MHNPGFEGFKKWGGLLGVETPCMIMSCLPNLEAGQTLT